MSSLLSLASRLRLKPYITSVATLNYLFMRVDDASFRIKGKSVTDLITRILPLLDGSYTVREILESLRDYQGEAITSFLEKWREMGFLELLNTDSVETKLSGDFNSQLAYFSRFNDPFDCLQRLRKCEVILVASGTVGKRMTLEFESSGIGSLKILLPSPLLVSEDTTPQEPAHDDKILINLETIAGIDIYDEEIYTRHGLSSNLLICASDTPDYQLFEALNHWSQTHGIPWLRCCLDGLIGYVGPLVIPGTTACYSCSELILLGNSRTPYEDYLLRGLSKNHNTRRGNTELTALPSHAGIVASIGTIEAIRYLSKSEKPVTVNALMTFKARDLSITAHQLQPHPSCAICRLRRPFLKPDELLRRWQRELNYPNGSLSEEELLNRLRQVIDPETGLIAASAQVFGDNSLTPKDHFFWQAIYRNPRIDPVLIMEADRINRFAGGSGLTVEEAELHALVEGVERYASIVDDPSVYIYEKYEEIHAHAIHPARLVLFLDEHYKQQGFKCKEFSPVELIPWVWGYSFSSSRLVLVPADFVYYPQLREKPLVLANSNGAAAHSSMQGAIANGIYEVVERDACMIMWMNRLSMPRIKISQLPGHIKRILDQLIAAKYRIHLIDITTDIPIPTVLAIAHHIQNEYPAMVVSTAANLDPLKAIEKAILQLEMQLLAVVYRKSTDQPRGVECLKTMLDHRDFYLAPEMQSKWHFMISSAKQLDFLKAHPYLQENTATTELGRLLDILNSQGLEAIAVDITPPDVIELGLRTCKVLIPELQPLHFGTKHLRLAGRRLYEVPYRLGYTKTATNPCMLNCDPHPFA